MAKKTSWKKWAVISVVVAGAAYGGWRYYKKNGEEKLEFKVAKAARGDVIQVVTASGQLNPVVTVQVGSQISGILQKLYVDFNSKVTNGQMVAQLDPASYLANLNQAEAELASAMAGMELVKLNADRTQKLFADNLLPKADFDKAMAELRQSESTVKIRQAIVEKANVDLARTTIFSTIDGVVISREVDVGQTVAASLNAPVLFKIANDLAKMQIDAMVAEADVGGIEVDQEVTFTVDAFPSRTFRGKVIQVRNAPITTQNVVTYDTVIEVHNKDLKLKPGMTASVSIIVASKENVVKVPNAALRFRPPESDVPKPAVAAAPPAPTATPVSSGSGGGANRERRGPGGFGGGQGGQRPGGGGGMRSERSGPKTIYLAERKVVAGEPVVEPSPVQVRTGITDGLFTEVLDGLKGEEEIIVGVQLPDSASAKPSVNPFGGGMRRF